VDEHDRLTQRFEEHRAHLRAVAFRMLGSGSEADDAVQDSWLRLNRSDTNGIVNLGGWLTTVVARVSLDMLRSRAARREDSSGEQVADRPADARDDPEEQTLLADAVGPALLVVLDTLSPAERLAFVLHDMFAVPFDEIASVLGRSPAAAKQLAHRARSRVDGSAPVPDTDLARQRVVVDAFLAASRGGHFDALLALLDPDIVLRADAAGIGMGSPAEVRGAASVAGVFSGRAMGAEVAVLDGLIGLAWSPGGRPKVVWDFTIADHKVVRIDMVAATDSLGELDLQLPGH
jgi:RNA polymerase sigma-70 factor (ECF subfamily)